MKTGTVKVNDTYHYGIMELFQQERFWQQKRLFYTQPPADSDWKKADTEGTYASYTNGVIM